MDGMFHTNLLQPLYGYFPLKIFFEIKIYYALAARWLHSVITM